MKTAVEWLVDELYKQGISLYTPELIEQAKEMEKGHIENAFENGMHAVNIHNLEQYYNETFKQQEK